MLKALFNNVSTSKKSELHGPTCYHAISVFDKVEKRSPDKIALQKASFSSSKKWNKTSDQIYHTHQFPP